MFCPFALGLHPSLGKKLDQIWVKTFSFFTLHLISGKNRTNFEWRPLCFCSSPNFGKKSESFKNLNFLLKFSKIPAPPPFQNPAYATGCLSEELIALSFFDNAVCFETKQHIVAKLQNEDDEKILSKGFNIHFVFQKINIS